MGKKDTEVTKGFVKKRITLSEPAFEMLEEIVKRGSFRSLSHGIEESIRIVHSIVQNPTMINVEVRFKRLGVSVKGGNRGEEFRT